MSNKIIKRLQTTLSPYNNSMSKVAACIIANEVLNGKTLDTNSNYLAKKCFGFGLRLSHIRVIPDDIDIIADTIRTLSRENELVFTSGGIGPTHDDLTYLSVAKAFNRPMHYNEETMNLMKEMLNLKRLDEGKKRMAYFPVADEVITTTGLWVPLVRVENVLIFPGVPLIFQKMIDHWFGNVLPTLPLKKIPMMRRLIKTGMKETTLAFRLEDFQNEVASKGIEIGSYPKLLKNGTTYVVISLVGPSDTSIIMEKVLERMKEEFNGHEITLDD